MDKIIRRKVYVFLSLFLIFSTGISFAQLDTDQDGLSDEDEINIYGTDPNNKDTDSDGMDDGWEVANSLDPLVNDAAADTDNDGAANFIEYKVGTNPQNAAEFPKLKATHEYDDKGQVISTQIIILE